MKYKWIIILFLGVNISLKAQDAWKSKYDSLGYFGLWNDTLAVVKKGGMYGVVTESGIEILPPDFDFVKIYFDYHEILVQKNQKYGVYSFEKEVAIPVEYDWIDTENWNSTVSVDVVKVKRDGKYGFVSFWEELVPPIYEDFEFYREFESISYFDRMDLTIATRDGKYGFVNKSGTEVCPFVYEAVIRFWDAWDISPYIDWDTKPARKSWASVKRNGKWGCLNAKFEEIVPCQYDAVIDWDRIVTLDGKYGSLDSFGKILIPLIYNQLVAVNKDTLIAQKGQKWGFVSPKGKQIHPFVFDYLQEKGDYFYISKNGKKGLLYSNFKEFLPTVYDTIFSKNDLFFARKNQKWGVLDKQGKELYPFVYDTIQERNFFYWEGEYLLKKDGLYGYLNTKNNRHIAAIYDTLIYGYPLDKNFFVVTQKNKTGLISVLDSVETILDCAYQNINYFAKIGKEYLLEIKKDGQYGLFNLSKRKMILPIDNDGITFFYTYREILEIKKEGKQGLFKLDDSNFVLEPIYDSIQFISYDKTVLRIEKDGKIGFYDYVNKIIISEPVYDSVIVFNNYSKNFKIYKKGKAGLFNETTRETVLEPIYDEIKASQVSEYYIFQQKQKYGLYNSLFRQATLCEYDELKPEGSRYHKGKKNGKEGIITDMGYFIDLAYYDEVEFNYATPYFHRVKKAGKWGILNSSGEIVIPAEYGFLRQDWSNNYWIAQKNKKVGLLDTKGNTIIPFEYESLERINQSDFFIVKQQKHYGVINLKNEGIVKTEYSYLYGKISQKNEQAFLIAKRKNKKYGVINFKEELLIDYQYDEMDFLWHYDSDSCLGFTTEKAKKWGAVNLQNKEIVPFNYRYTVSMDGYIITAEYKDNAAHFYSPQGKIYDYDDVIALSDANGNVLVLGVKKDGKWGVIDLENNIIVPIEYEKPYIDGAGEKAYLYMNEIDGDTFYFNLKGEKIEN